tara:strand:+ start:901 stop:1833 length:933 start_codon:yes stop_codon:yes gene_type:complete
MKTLRVKAPAKINLHLEVLGLREDGFHELAMVMQAISLFDELNMKLRNDGKISLHSSNKSLSCMDDNLIVKAAKLLKDKAKNNDLGVDIYLDKKIPIGAGLAGGSSDAAATLLGLNSLWELGFSKLELEKFASLIGSDVPFCISGGTQLCFGRGEKLEPLKEPINIFSLLLVKDPLISVSTPWAYSKCKEIKGSEYLKTEEDFEKKRQNLRDASWLNFSITSSPPPLINDLQNVVIPYYPQVDKALSLLSSFNGSLSVSMSGSGASCFALFKDLDELSKICTKYDSRIESEGFQSWCCSFINHGPEIFYD